MKRQRYTDPRVQAVFDRECQARHMQAILRLRQMINSYKIAVVFTAEPIGGLPIAPVPFKLTDAEACLESGQEWSDLQQFIEERKAETDVQVVMESDGVSKRTAERRTKDNRAEKREHEREQVKALHDAGKNKSEISRITGIPRATINRILKG